MGPGLLQSLRFALVLGLLVVGGLLLYELIGVVEVLVLALLIALVLAPAVDFLVGVGLPRFLALLVVVMGVILSFGLLGYIVVPLILDQGGEFVARAPGVARRVQEYAQGMGKSYPILGGDGGAASLDLTEAVQQVIQRAGELWRFTTRGAGLLLQAVGAVVMALYMVSNPRPLVNGILALFPMNKRGRVEEILDLIRRRISGWILGQLAAMALIFILTWISLVILGVEFAFTFAVLTGLLQIVPFFGPMIAAVPPILVAFVDSPTKALLIVVVYVVIHQIEAHVVSPMVMARSVRLHPVVVILAVLAMGDLLGLAGIILAVPTAAVVTVLLDELYVKPLGASTEPEGPEDLAEPAGSRSGPGGGRETAGRTGAPRL